MISTSITSNSITVVVTNSNGNKVYSIQSSHPNYADVLDAIRNGDELAIESLCNISKSIEVFAEGHVSVKNGHVYYRDTVLHGLVVDHILEFISKKLSPVPMLKFINKLMNNPSYRATNELYSFLQHRQMPITPDGNFIAYKGVQTNYYSVHSGTITLLTGKADGVNNTGHIYNGVGEYISVPRNEVCDNKEIHCAQGLHAGSLDYALGWGSRRVLVEINPIDVISIPDDCGCMKLRACAYKVIGDYVSPLNNTYCDAYSSCANDGDDDGCSAIDDGEDQESVLQEDDDIAEEAFEAGWNDGYAGEKCDVEYDGCIELPQYQLTIWSENYAAGYADGEADRIEEDDESDSEALYDVGYAAGYRDAFNSKSYGASSEHNSDWTEADSEYHQKGYNKGYDAGVKNRK